MKDAMTKIKGPGLLKIFGKRNVHAAFIFHDLMVEYGNVVKCGPFFYIINHPDIAKQIYFNDQKGFLKEDFANKRGRNVFGKGLIVNQGESWATQRKILSPVFSYNAVNDFIQIVCEEIDKRLSHWEKISRIGNSIDMVEEMGTITILSSGRILFDADLTAKVSEIKNILETTTGYMYNGLPIYIPFWFPTKTHLRIRRVNKEIDSILNPILDNRLKLRTRKHDMLNALIKEINGPTIAFGKRRLILDEMKTIMGANFANACALSMFWHVMGQHPDHLKEIVNEIRATPEDYRFSDHFYRDFPLTNNAIMEVLRLYPVAYSNWRKSVTDNIINGYLIPKGKTICVSLYNLHRNPEIWDRPNEFIPSRFDDEKIRNQPAHYFTPFGRGSRKCFGEHYAIMITFLTVIKVLQRFDIEILCKTELDLKPIALMCPKSVNAKVKVKNEK